MPRLLFLCSRNRLRSPTSAEVFADEPGLEVDSAGLSPDAVVPVTPEQIEWADLIFVVESSHRRRLNERFARHLRGKRVVVLNIPDDYAFMDPALVELLQNKVRRHLR